MFHTILVALDGSALAERALRVAGALAKAAEAQPGKSGLLQLLAGSVTQGVLARTRVPVLVVPPPGRS